MENNPDIYKDGHTDIAHPVAEKFACFRLSGEEWQILWVIIRQTWGWHKAWTRISLTKLSELTKIKRANVIRVLKKLSSKNIISIKKDTRQNTKANKYHINSHFNKWQGGIKKDTTPSINMDTTPVSKKIPLKSPRLNELAKLRDSKEISTKEISTTKSSSQELNINHIMVLYQKKFPEQRKLYGMGGVIRAREYFESIIESGFTHKDIEIAINKAINAAPWNIIKPKKPESPLKRALREKREKK